MPITRVALVANDIINVDMDGYKVKPHKDLKQERKNSEKLIDDFYKEGLESIIVFKNEIGEESFNVLVQKIYQEIKELESEDDIEKTISKITMEHGLDESAAHFLISSSQSGQLSFAGREFFKRNLTEDFMKCLAQGTYYLINGDPKPTLIGTSGTMEYILNFIQPLDNSHIQSIFKKIFKIEEQNPIPDSFKNKFLNFIDQIEVLRNYANFREEHKLDSEIANYLVKNKLIFLVDGLGHGPAAGDTNAEIEILKKNLDVLHFYVNPHLVQVHAPKIIGLVKTAIGAMYRGECILILDNEMNDYYTKLLAKTEPPLSKGKICEKITNKFKEKLECCMDSLGIEVTRLHCPGIVSRDLPRYNKLDDNQIIEKNSSSLERLKRSLIELNYILKNEKQSPQSYSKKEIPQIFTMSKKEDIVEILDLKKGIVDNELRSLSILKNHNCKDINLLKHILESGIVIENEVQNFTHKEEILALVRAIRESFDFGRSIYINDTMSKRENIKNIDLLLELEYKLGLEIGIDKVQNLISRRINGKLSYFDNVIIYQIERLCTQLDPQLNLNWNMKFVYPSPRQDFLRAITDIRSPTPYERKTHPEQEAKKEISTPRSFEGLRNKDSKETKNKEKTCCKCNIM